MSANGESHTTIQTIAPGQAPQTRQEDTTVRLQAIERVVTVDPRGKPLETEYTIERFESVDATGTHDVLHPGQVLDVVRGARGTEPQLTVGGAAADPAVRRALSVVATLTVDDTTDDDIFGSAQRQAIGATWPADGDVAQRELARTGQNATLTGQTTLVRRAASHGIDCLEFSSQLNGTINGAPNLPAGIVFRSGSMRSTMRAVLPVTVTLPEVTNSIDMTMESVTERAIGGSGTRGEVHVTVRRRKEQTRTRL